MQKEQLLSLLDTSAREAFERAKPLARARGGVLTPLHILIALLEDSAPASEQSAELLHSATDALLSRYTQPGETITIPKDTQAVISRADRLAQRLLRRPRGRVARLFRASVRRARARIDGCA
ncbi:MAG TPA: hypothetical protein VJX74_04300 [Blastocatellia bacterium]|nr:hypothetical protein [Blastocatellia bacterium]